MSQNAASATASVNGAEHAASAQNTGVADQQQLLQQNVQLRSNLTKLKNKLVTLSKAMQISELLDKSTNTQFTC